VIGTPGEPYTPSGIEEGGQPWEAHPGDVWYRWYHDCGNGTGVSFGDAITRNGQVITLWFQGCAQENVIRMSNGDFYVLDAHGNDTQIAETPQERAFSDNQRKALSRVDAYYCGVFDTLKALQVPGSSDEHEKDCAHVPDEVRTPAYQAIQEGYEPDLPLSGTGPRARTSAATPATQTYYCGMFDTLTAYGMAPSHDENCADVPNGMREMAKHGLTHPLQP